MMEKMPFDEDALINKYNPDFAFAYGSGVFKQEGYPENERPMIDLVFGVRNAKT